MGIGDALDRAFAGEDCELVRADETSRPMSIAPWTCDATASDHEMFVSRCQGPTLDVGCGPGRLSAALLARGVDAVGIDISHEAVRLARARGAVALQADVFDHFPGRKRWPYVLLADGNIGLGGDPLRLLRRVASLLATDGSALIDLAGTTGATTHEQVRLRIGHRYSVTFDWATVGTGAIHELARAAGLEVARMDHSSGRWVATLRHCGHYIPTPEPLYPVTITRT